MTLLQHPLRADRDAMKIFFIENLGSENEREIELITEPFAAGDTYLTDLETAVNNGSRNKKLLKQTKDKFIMNEVALEKLVSDATKYEYQVNQVKRAAQAANMIQPNVTAFNNPGEMFLQQIVYSPIAEMFCAFSTSYCADKEVACAHGVYVHENGNNREQYTASCLPDAALRLTTEFYLIAMMELNCEGSGEPYHRDLFRCKLMTAMSVMAIADFLVEKRNIDRANIDIAIPFIRGCFACVELCVMRLKGVDSPKFHLVFSTRLWGSPDHSGKIDLLSKLAVILSRIVKETIDHKVYMAFHFQEKVNTNAAAIARNILSSKSNANSKKRKTEEGGNHGTNTKQPSSGNENAAKLAASCSGLIYNLVYPFLRIRELDTIKGRLISTFASKNPLFSLQVLTVTIKVFRIILFFVRFGVKVIDTPIETTSMKRFYFSRGRTRTMYHHRV